MKSSRNTIAAMALAFALSTPAFAAEGIMHTEKTPPPPPPQAEVVLHMDKTAPAPEGNTLTEIALGLLQTLLPLL